MNIDHLQRFHHDSTGVHHDSNGEYLWYEDVISVVKKEQKEREEAVQGLRAILETEQKSKALILDRLDDAITAQMRLENADLTDGIERALEKIDSLEKTIANLGTELLCLCEKMEAGISGQEETKRARGLLDAIKAKQEKKS